MTGWQRYLYQSHSHLTQIAPLLEVIKYPEDTKDREAQRQIFFLGLGVVLSDMEEKPDGSRSIYVNILVEKRGGEVVAKPIRCLECGSSEYRDLSGFAHFQCENCGHSWKWEKQN